MKKAYTLSEVLVVLLVLGVISVFILPAVMKAAPDRAALLYRKSFYATQEAVKKIINDTSLYPEHDPDPDSDDPDYIPPVLFTDNDNFCTNFAHKMNVTGIIDCNVDDTNFISTNGVEWKGLNATFGSAADDKDKFIIATVKCNKQDFKIRIYADGRVGTGSGDDWEKENSILKTPFGFKKEN